MKRVTIRSAPRRLRSIALLAWLFASPVMAAPQSISEFRDRMAAAAVAATTGQTEVVDKGAFKLKRAGADELQINVDNAYARYLEAPDDIDGIIELYVRTMLDADIATGDLAQLIVIVRPVDYFPGSNKRAAAQPPANRPIQSRPMAGDLTYLLAIDSPTTIRTATTDDLARWQIDAATAWNRATANIKARMGPLVSIRLGDSNGATGIGADSGLAPSMLADSNFCGAAAPDGSPKGVVVLVISRESFLFGVPADAGSMQLFWAATKRLIGEDSSLSKTPLSCRGGKWETVPLP